MGKCKTQTGDPKRAFQCLRVSHYYLQCLRAFCYYYYYSFIKVHHWVANDVTAREPLDQGGAVTFNEGQVQPLNGGSMICWPGQCQELPRMRNHVTLRVTLTGHVGCGSPYLAQPHPPVGLLESHQHLPAELQLELPTPSFMTLSHVCSRMKVFMCSSEAESFVGSPWVTASVSGQGPACTNM